MATARDIYASAVAPLPASERLRLAALILDGLAETAADALDYSDEWTAQDMQDLANFSAQYAARTIGEE